MAAQPPKRPRMQLEDLLLRHGAISEQQLELARDDQKQLGGDVGRILVDKGFISEELLLRAMAHQMEIPLLDPEALEIRPELLQAVPVQICERYGVIAVEGDPAAKTLRMATADPGNREHLREVGEHLGMRLEAAAATAASIELAIRRHYYGEQRKQPMARVAPKKVAPAPKPKPRPAPQAPQPGELLSAIPDGAAPAMRPKATRAAAVQAMIDLDQPVIEGDLVEGQPLEGSPLDEQSLPEVSLEPEVGGGMVHPEELAALAERVARLEAFVTQPQFAAALARVERLEQIAAQLAQAVRVIGGVLVDHELVSLEEYRKRTGR